MVDRRTVGTIIIGSVRLGFGNEKSRLSIIRHHIMANLVIPAIFNFNNNGMASY